MPDNVEKIVLQVEESDAIKSTKAVTDEFEKLEKTAGKAGEAIGKTGETIVRVTQRSKASLERTTSSFEQKYQTANLDKIQRIQAEMALRSKQVEGSPEHQARIKAAGEAAIEKERHLELVAAAEKKQAEALRVEAAAQAEANRKEQEAIKLEEQNRRGLQAETDAIYKNAQAWIARNQAAKMTPGQKVQAEGQEIAGRLRTLGHEAQAQFIEKEAAREGKALDTAAKKKALLDAAVRASKEAEGGIKRFADAEALVEKRTKAANQALAEQQKTMLKNAETARNIAERAQYRVASATGRLDIERAQALREAPAATKEQVATINKSFDELIKKQKESDAIAARNKLVTNLRSTADAASNLLTPLFAMGAAAGGALVWLTKIGGEFEKMQIAFNSLLGSKAAGEAFFKSLIDYSKRSVFSLQDIAHTAQQAIALGFKPEQAKKVVEAGHAIAAAMGGTAEVAQRVVLALGQMQAKQRVSAEEMRQISEIGFGGWQELARVAGKTVPEMMKLAEKGMLDANVAVEILTRGLLKFAKTEQELRKTTLAGKIADLRQQLDFLALDMQKTLLPVAKDVLDIASKLFGVVTYLAKAFAALPPEMRTTALALAGLGAAALVGMKGLTMVTKWTADFLELLGKKEVIAGFIARMGGVATVMANVGFLTGTAVISMIDFSRRMADIEQRRMDALAKAFPDPTKALSVLEEAYKRETDAINKSNLSLERRIELLDDLAQGYEAGKARIAAMPRIGFKGTPEEIAAQEAQAKQAGEEFRKKRQIIIPGSKEEEEWKKQLIRDREMTEEELKRRAAEMARHLEAARDIREQAEKKTAYGLEKINLEHLDRMREHGKRADMIAELEIAHRLEVVKYLEDFRKQALKATIEDEKEAAEKRIFTNNQVFETTIKQQKEEIENAIRFLKDIEQIYDRVAQVREEAVAARLEKQRDIDLAGIEFAKERIENEVVLLDMFGKQQMEKKLALENRKFEIEVEYFKKREQLKQIEIQREAQRDIEKLRREARRPGANISAEELSQAIEARQQQAEDERKVYSVQTEADIQKARISLTQETNRILQQQYKTTFDFIRSTASTVLDQLFTKTQGWAQAMKSLLTTLILQPLKQIAATWIALILTGRRAAGGGGGFGGGSGAGVNPLSLAGAAISGGSGIFGGGSGGFGGGAGGTLDTFTTTQRASQALSLYGANPGANLGATPSFGARLGAFAGGPLMTLGGAQLAMMGAQRGGILGGLSTIGGLGMAGYSVAKLAGVYGGGPMGAAAGIGAGLAIAGAQRGGKLGAAMTIGGAALTGAAIGTMIMPIVGTAIGAIIGAAIGGGIALYRSLRKSAEEKMIEKVKQLYGVTISKQLAKDFVERAKSNYAGDLDMAVRSPEIRELVKLYALSTGQHVGNMPRTMHGVEIAQTGGGLSVQPVYEGGNVVANPYTGPTEAAWMEGSWGNNVYVQLDPNQANSLLEGRVVKIVERNTDAVTTAVTKGTRAGSNRNASRSAYLEPATTMA